MQLLLTLRSLRPRLLRVLSRKLGCEDAADDVYQMLSEQLLSSESSRQVKNPEAYLLRAASNTANSYHRAESTRQVYESQAGTADVVADDSAPDGSLQAEEALAVVECALNELPLLTKNMFLAFRLDGMAQRQIARKFGVSLSTVEKRIALATLHCHRRLRESCDPNAGPGHQARVEGVPRGQSRKNRIHARGQWHK